MAKNNMVVAIRLMETVEELVRQNEDLSKTYATGHQVFDFVPGDFVKCTLLKGYHKVYDIAGDKVVVSNIDENGDLENVDPNFLKKIDLDRRWVKVLYEHRSRRLHSW